MNIRQLKKLVNALPEDYLDRPVYYATEFKNDTSKETFEPESLTEINEFAIDTDDNVIVFRGILGW